MNQNQPAPTNFWLFLEVLALRRGLILGLVILGAVGSAVVSLLLPKWYEAEALLLPPKDASLPTVGSADLADLASLTGGVQLPVMVTPSDIYARMLSSRAIIDSIIVQFDLRSRYRTSNMVETRNALLGHARFRVTEEGLVSIRVEDREPAGAAELVNGFVDRLGRLNHQIVNSRARRSREFIESRLESVTAELDSARFSLERFQTENKALDFDAQTRLAISQAVDLKIEAARVETEIDLNRAVLGGDNPKLVELRKRLLSIKEQLSRLEFGGSDSSYFSLPLSEIPGLKGQYEALHSRVEVSESLYLTLLELYEQAKIQEESQTVPISVLDQPAVPELRSRPQRTLIVMGSTLVSFILAVLLALFLEYFNRLSQSRPEDYVRAMRFVDAYLGWLPGVRRRSPS
ncbi:MAG: hypothetical protein JSU65_14100 [Candidatus Zixiibacteriota bacterium]|nr:MAG: hypothetical protein JSU65_14100 [candidate division Zixibacteria bacterium]